MRAETATIDREQQQQVVSAAALDREPAVHIGFGRGQLGIEKYLALDLLIVKADRHVRAVRTTAEGMAAAVVSNDRQTSLFAKPPQQMLQEKQMLTPAWERVKQIP